MEPVRFVLHMGYSVVNRIRKFTGSSVQIVPAVNEDGNCNSLESEYHTSPVCMPRRATDYTKSDSFSCLPSQHPPYPTANLPCKTLTTTGSNVSTDNCTPITAEASPVAAEPTTQAELDIILRKMLTEPTDEYGKDRLAPSLKHWGFLAENLPMVKNGTFAIEKVHYNTKYIFESETTTVYDVLHHPDIVVRYHMHVNSRLSPIDTTVVDYWFLKRLQHTGLVAQVHYFSAALDPNKYDAHGYICETAPPGKTRKTDAPTRKRNDKPCIRYTILEKVGLSVTAYCALKPHKAVPFMDAIKMGGQMIMLLEKLHSHNYIHGDMHMGNFAIHHNKLIFIDFGHARIIHDSELSSHCETNFQMNWYHRFLSAWEMQKFQASYRDDVYRALQGVANIIHGDPYSKYLEYLYSSPEGMGYHQYMQLRECFVDIKLSGGIFEILSSNDVDNSMIEYPDNIVSTFTLADKVPHSALTEIRYILSTLMSSLLTVSIGTKPDYEQIKRGLADIVWLLVHADDITECDDVHASYDDASLEEVFHVDFT